MPDFRIFHLAIGAPHTHFRPGFCLAAGGPQAENPPPGFRTLNHASFYFLCPSLNPQRGSVRDPSASFPTLGPTLSLKFLLAEPVIESHGAPLCGVLRTLGSP